MDLTSSLPKHSTLSSTRPHSMTIEPRPLVRPRPVPSLLPKTEIGQENLHPSNAHPTHHLSASTEFPRRSTSVPFFTKASRSLSVSDSSLTDRRLSSDDEMRLKLPTVHGQCPKAISTKQLADLMRDEKKDELYDEIMILDARFDYEHEGGHISGAHNVYLAEHIDDLKERILGKQMGARLCIIIHCEFSSIRGPSLFRQLRAWDRDLNEYPKLHFPEMYILKGGYKAFYFEYPELCEKGYVPMHHKDFTTQCQDAKKLTRSQSSTKIKRVVRASCETSSPLFGVRESPTQQTMITTTESLSASRISFTSNGKLDAVLSISTSSLPSFSPCSTSTLHSSTTIDDFNGSDTDDDMDDCPFPLPTSPAALRTRTAQHSLPRYRHDRRVHHSTSMQHISIRRSFTQSMADLSTQHFYEDDEDPLFRPVSSRS